MAPSTTVLAGHPICSGIKTENPDHRDNDQRDQLHAGVVRPQQNLRFLDNTLVHAPEGAALVVALQAQDRTEQSAGCLAQFDSFFVEPFTGRPFQRQNADWVGVLQQRHRTNRDVPLFSGQFGMGDGARVPHPRRAGRPARNRDREPRPSPH
jgi:hypothetical protein